MTNVKTIGKISFRDLALKQSFSFTSMCLYFGMMNNNRMIFRNRHIILKAFICILLSSGLLAGIANATNSALKQACLISAKTLKQKNLQHTMLFIDIRDKSLFSKNQVMSSINIPLNLIKTKSFLKNKSLLLIGNGWNEQAVKEECVLLKSKKFKSVRVLAGGIISLYKNKSHLTKRPFISLTSKEFFNNKIEKNFVPFVVSNKKNKRINAILPHAKIIPLTSSKKKLLDKLNSLGKGKNPLVIFSESNPIVDTALNDYLKKPLRKIYYFEGGFTAYEKVVNLNKRTTLGLQIKRFSTKKPVSCAN